MLIEKQEIIVLTKIAADTTREIIVYILLQNELKSICYNPWTRKKTNFREKY